MEYGRSAGHNEANLDPHWLYIGDRRKKRGVANRVKIYNTRSDPSGCVLYSLFKATLATAIQVYL
jgi:hypothetical protein